MTDIEQTTTIKIILPDQTSVTKEAGRSLLEISEEVAEHYASPIVAAIVNDKMKDLTHLPQPSSVVKFLDLGTTEGARIYQRSLTFLLIYATRLLFPDAQISVEHSLGKGLYCEINKTPALTTEDVAALQHKMRELVLADLPIEKKKIPLQQAIDCFKQAGFDDKVRLYKNWPTEALTVYSLGALTDSLHGYMVTRTGILQWFAVHFRAPGLVLRFPNAADPFTIPPYIEQHKLFGIFRETEEWSEILGFHTVGILNERIEAGQGPEIMRINEALHEKKIAQIADSIAARKDELRIVLIAGPSSSGKTTFTQRLRIQLLVNGIRPFPISLDDYFVDREHTPLDENNQPDFEHLEAIDLELFNNHLLRLIDGEKIEIPRYNFHTGKREYHGHTIELQENQLLLIEGIHGLNERLTEAISRRHKYKIYISALTALNVDNHTRIHTTDTRLLRRIIRDHQFRSYDALETIRRWPSVRRGEERNLFHLQEEADIMFNSSLVYELAILKQFATPLLQEISHTEPEYIDAKRLLLFLSCFASLELQGIPNNSILREFIGGSCFHEI
ncbi:MAG TPA: nucleoside kinase [Oscillospiraceae bacterium]|nr:nucleoside kinase [Oscillospiraceae bacterium]